MTELTKLSVEEIEALEIIELPVREALTGFSGGSLIDVDVDADVDVDVNLGGCCKDKCH
ncbi:MAG TPA: hypothetical protein VHS99_15900 [Chloroflexota bacterium]|nr:hypothetical protein [Chloroflexota bacterium]